MMIPLLIWTLGQCPPLQFLFILSCLSHMPMILLPYPLISPHRPLFQLYPEDPLVSSRNLGIFVTITAIWWMLHTKFLTIHPIPSPRFSLMTCYQKVTVHMLFPSHYILSPNSCYVWKKKIFFFNFGKRNLIVETKSSTNVMHNRKTVSNSY